MRCGRPSNGHGSPKAIRRDSGHRYLSAAITVYHRMGPTVRHQARLHPGGQAPQNAYVEQFDRSMRYEWLSQYHWKDLDRVQRFTTDWSWTDH